MKKFLYFQPEYVKEFKCDGSKCINNCCLRSWNIVVDKATYKKCQRIQPKEKAKEILSHFEYSDKYGNYLLKVSDRSKK